MAKRPEDVELKWLEAHENRFGIRVLDCSPLTQAWVSVATDLDVAASFGALRHSMGRGHVGNTPSGATHYDCTLRYPFDGKVGDGPLFLASVMEDKWDIYLYEGVLYFARSWTGDLLAVARIEFTSVATITALEAAIPGEVSVGAPYPVRVVDFLMKSHLYNQIVPHPLPRDLTRGRRPHELAGYSMSLWGRRALFASFEDTTTYDPWATTHEPLG